MTAVEPTPPPRLLDRAEDVGRRASRAFDAWQLLLLKLAVLGFGSAIGVKIVNASTWPPVGLGIGGIVGSAGLYLLRWKFPLQKPPDTS